MVSIRGKVIGVRKGHLLKTSGKNVIPEKRWHCMWDCNLQFAFLHQREIDLAAERSLELDINVWKNIEIIFENENSSIK